MGCCFSTPSAATAPAVQVARDDQRLGSSRVAIVPAAQVTTHSSGTAVPSSTRPANVHAPRPNAPIRLPSPIRKSPKDIRRHERPWTRRVLEQERTDFFDTRVTGQKEVWDALRLVSELLRQKNVADAQEVLRAVGLTCPTGRVASGGARGSGGTTTATATTTSTTTSSAWRRGAGGIYDERGELYELPAWVLRDPDDIIADEAARQIPDKHRDGMDSDDEDEEVAGNESESKDELRGAAPSSPVSSYSAEKGKGRVLDEGRPMKLRARLSHAEEQTVRDILVDIGNSTRVSVLMRRIMDHLESTTVSAPYRLRILYFGQPWDDGAKTLEQQGYREGTVVQVLILPVWNS